MEACFPTGVSRNFDECTRRRGDHRAHGWPSVSRTGCAALAPTCVAGGNPAAHRAIRPASVRWLMGGAWELVVFRALKWPARSRARRGFASPTLTRTRVRRLLEASWRWRRWGNAGTLMRTTTNTWTASQGTEVGHASSDAGQLVVAKIADACGTGGQASQFRRSQALAIFRVFPSTNYINGHISPFSFWWGVAGQLSRWGEPYHFSDNPTTF
jgi:hypothetical protein